MKNIVLKHGLYATSVVVGIPFLLWVFVPGEPNYDLGEVIGYATMILCMAFVFLGIREHRDHQLQGVISFWQALKLGMSIALIPSLAFGIYDLLYVAYLDPDFYDAYYSQYIAELKSSLTEDDFEKALAEIEAQEEIFTNPVLQFLVMFLTVFLIGFVVSLLSSLVLKRSATA